MRTSILIILLILASNSLAADRAQMIEYFIALENVETQATEIIEKLQDELVGSDKHITHANFSETFGEIFEDYRDAYIEANAKAYDVYSDAQIQDLYDFYQSDFGKWYRQEEENYGPRVRDLMKNATETWQQGIIDKRQSKKKRR